MDAETLFDAGDGRGYSAVLVHEDWALSRHAHPAVAAGVHAISTAFRSADDIFSRPTDDELRAVAAVVSDHISNGTVTPEDDGEYAWGWRPLVVLHVGATIDIGVGDDRDSGRVLALGERRVFVAWESGVKSWAPITSPWVHAATPYSGSRRGWR